MSTRKPGLARELQLFAYSPASCEGSYSNLSSPKPRLRKNKRERASQLEVCWVRFLIRRRTPSEVNDWPLILHGKETK